MKGFVAVSIIYLVPDLDTLWKSAMAIDGVVSRADNLVEGVIFF